MHIIFHHIYPPQQKSHQIFSFFFSFFLKNYQTLWFIIFNSTSFHIWIFIVAHKILYHSCNRKGKKSLEKHHHLPQLDCEIKLKRLLCATPSISKTIRKTVHNTYCDNVCVPEGKQLLTDLHTFFFRRRCSSSFLFFKNKKVEAKNHFFFLFGRKVCENGENNNAERKNKNTMYNYNCGIIMRV